MFGLEAFFIYFALTFATMLTTHIVCSGGVFYFDTGKRILRKMILSSIGFTLVLSYPFWRIHHVTETVQQIRLGLDLACVVFGILTQAEKTRFDFYQRVRSRKKENTYRRS